MSVLFKYYPNGKKRALTMSYDDGRRQDIRLVEIFNKYGIKGTFHLNSGLFGRDNYVTSDEIKDLYKGHEVSSHTLTHPHLRNIPKSELVSQVLEDRKILESLTGYPVRGMSYPFGTYNNEILDVLSGLDIEYSRTTASHGGFHLPENFLTWHPTCHHKGDIIEKYKVFNSFRYQNMPLFYIWGHSYEFDNDNNWELIEEFCKTAAFDEDTWYATNIEIMDYVTALKNLKFSVDRKTVYNPSSISVWIDSDGNAAEIKPGKTTKL